jgi:L,D-peptidoglycan transpeptidase YkuD (ErfK/YbiS/YcfS/YnhG family)
VGRWALRRVLYRADRGMRPRANCEVRPLTTRDGWCDCPSDRNYNRPVRLPYPARVEAMWRGDRLYDIVVVLGHNERPRVRGHGSAIFLHVARPDRLPTEGCIALKRRNLELILARMRRGAAVRVVA